MRYPYFYIENDKYNHYLILVNTYHFRGTTQLEPRLIYGGTFSSLDLEKCIERGMNWLKGFKWQ